MNFKSLVLLASAVVAQPLDFLNSFQDISLDGVDFGLGAFGNQRPLVETEALQKLVSEDGLRLRAEQLYNISLTLVGQYGNPTRVIGLPGHWNTIHYILRELRRMDGYYTVKTQAFNAVDGKVNSFSLLIDGHKPKLLEALLLTPPTKDGNPVNGKLVLVKGHGCNAKDFPSDAKDNIVLIERGECSFGDKLINAGDAGAVGAIIYDKDGPLHGTLGTPTGREVATVLILEKEAQPYIDQLKKDPKAFLETTLYVDAYVKNVTTLNVIAETVDGDHNNVVLLGAHLDSVSAGPGINDDGSGTISLLEVAKLLTQFKVKNAVRFAWWAAEEEGLLGLNYYAQLLLPEENQKVRVFMDYDMMALPNYEYEVYDANNKDHPAGLGDLKDLYIDWYKDHGFNYTLIPFDGRLDYVGFIEAGIPAGGIATGAEGVKLKKLQEKFGGNAGEWFDKCYHQLCDDLTNPNYEAWVTNTQLIAHSVATYARSFDGFPKREKVKTAAVAQFLYRGEFLFL